jgi:hypothetical protein
MEILMILDGLGHKKQSQFVSFGVMCSAYCDKMVDSDLKKQTQFVGGPNRRKVLFGRKLWQ